MTESAAVLVADAARVVVEPELGGRITSIRLGGREWLQQPAVALTPAAPFDSFVRSDMGGWDEMVPTCSPFIDRGNALPDHGEVWSRPWRVVVSTPAEFEVEIECAVVPLMVRRALRLEPSGLSLDYSLTNVGAAPTPAFWMAHPLFDADRLTSVTLHPPGVVLRRTIAGPSEPVEPETETHLLPSTLPQGGYRKYRAEGAVRTVDLAADDGTTLTMSWSAPVPMHVQLWVDNAGIGPAPVVAPEPAIAYGDHPAEARRAGALPVLDAGASIQFSVSLSMT